MFNLDNIGHYDPTIFLVRIAHSVGQIQFATYPTEHDARIELARLAPLGTIDGPYGIKQAWQFRATTLAENQKEEAKQPFLEIVETDPKDWPIFYQKH